MKVTFFFRPRKEGIFSIETVFENIQRKLPPRIIYKNFICTEKFKRFYSYLISNRYQGQINHITGDIHTIALFLNKTRTILTVHDIGRYERDLKGIKKKLVKLIWLDLPLRRVKYITTISEYTKKKLVETCDINPKKIIVIPNPACEDFNYSPKEFNVVEPVILQIGSSPVKNLYRLIKAVKNTRCRLLLVRRETPELIAILKKNNINYSFRYNLSRKEVYECYRNSDIVFFASLHEGFGVPIQEAQSVGRVIITSNIAPMNEVAGQGAYFVNPLDEVAIQKALELLRSNHELRQKLIKEGRENLKRFNAEMIAKKYVEVYEKLLN